jgi:hypothetical protein
VLSTPKPVGKELATYIAELVTKLVAAGRLTPLSVKLMPKGLESVEEGFEYMKQGKVSLNSSSIFVSFYADDLINRSAGRRSLIVSRIHPALWLD